MPPLSAFTAVNRIFAKHRVLTARTLLRNIAHTAIIESDMRSCHHIAELSDDYALAIALIWLSTRYGSSQYAGNIASIGDFQKYWGVLCTEYPFANCADLNSLQLSPFFKVLNDCGISWSLLGSLYEHICRNELDIHDDALPHIAKKDKRDRNGQFYTPPNVVAYCLSDTLGDYSKELMSQLKRMRKSPCDESGDERDVFRLLDPSCGTGNFLLGAIEELDQYDLSSWDKVRFAQECLYGFDVDARAVSLTRVILLLYTMCQVDGVSQDDIAFMLAALRKHVHVADSAALAASNRLQNRFDLVATNPPYISFGSRNHNKMAHSSDRLLRTTFGASAEYKIRLHSIFQEAALRLVKPEGSVVMLVPDAFLTGSYYAKLRKLLLEKTRLVSLTELPENAVPLATVGRWCVARYQLKSETEIVEKASSVDYAVSVKSVSRVCNGENVFASNAHKLPISVLVARDKQRFRLVFSKVDEQIAGLLDACAPLNRKLIGHTGMRAKKGQNSIVSRQQQDPGWQRGIISGSSVSRHFADWSGHWLNTDPQLLYSGGFDSAVIGNPKIMLRQTGDSLIAAVDTTGLYHLNNVHSFSPRDKQAERLLFAFSAILNSTWFVYTYRLKTREHNRPLAQIDIEMVESMPLPADEGYFTELRLLGQEASSLAGTQLKSQNSSKMLSFVERCIDTLVYSSYKLSPSMIEHIEQRSDNPAPLPDIEEARMHCMKLERTFEETAI